ncbi:MAG: drug/metabolite transporter (DMT)-like permease [Phenylobacterium sp.]|jgi:drug/metabolite transporter (DMT)-like permease
MIVHNGVRYFSGIVSQVLFMASYNFRLGLLFISIAVLSWGALPVALKLSSAFIDPVTLTWFRFLIAFGVTLAWQCFTGQLSQFRQLTTSHWFKLALATVFSVLNYNTFTFSLDYLTPGQAQLNFQSAPFFLAFGGMLFFKEKLRPIQMMCFATLALGMMMFFHPYLDWSTMSQNDGLWLGILIIHFSALSWTCYSLIQKSLFSQLSANNILLFIYGFGLMLMLPFSELSHFAQMQQFDWLIAFYCALNTILGYGCFAQAMKYWPMSQLGPMISLTPIITFSSTALVVSQGWWPQVFQSDDLDGLMLAGVSLVILSVVGIQWFPRLQDQWRNKRPSKLA